MAKHSHIMAKKKSKERLVLTPFGPDSNELPAGSPGVIVFECDAGHKMYGAIPAGYRLEDVTPDRYEFILPPHEH